MGFLDRIFESKELREARGITDILYKRADEKATNLVDLLLEINKEIVKNSNLEIKMWAIGKILDPVHQKSRDAACGFIEHTRCNMAEFSPYFEKMRHYKYKSIEGHEQRRHFLEIFQSNIDSALVVGEMHHKRVRTHNNLTNQQYLNLSGVTS